MKALSLVILLTARLVAAEGLQSRSYAAACNADNCARAVTGTQAGIATKAAHLSECSSYLKATVFPSTVITTVTVSSTVYSISGNSGYTSTNVSGLDACAGPNTAKTVTPTSLPSYVSTACNGESTPLAVRYSSACSCAGITRSTTTLSTPSFKTTSTVTITANVSSFRIIASRPTSGAAYLINDDPADPPDYSHTITFAKNGSLASSFSLLSGALELGGLLLSDQERDTIGEALYFDTPENIHDYNWVTVDVVVDAKSLAVTALNPRNNATTFLNCQSILCLVTSSDTSDLNSCGPVTALKAVPL
ncbi:MAG: hypothetical protein M1818_001867 [Claussenomyces sp. TS43310]|nr:MAG: hypothetical protein M1818_001867 [Claussenomyces sp. TS43310]